jgi:hypothetical protein
MTHPVRHHLLTPGWAVLAWSLPYGWYEPPPPPDPADLPSPGHYHLDPGRSGVRAGIRRRRRWSADATGLVGTLRVGCGLAVDLAVETAGLRTGDPARDRALHDVLDPPSFPLLRFTAGELATAHGAWLVPGQVTLRGRAAPLVLWLHPVHTLPDGAITLGLRGTLERRASGLSRRVELELTLVATRETAPSAPPRVAGSELRTGAA